MVALDNCFLEEVMVRIPLGSRVGRSVRYHVSQTWPAFRLETSKIHPMAIPIQNLCSYIIIWASLKWKLDIYERHRLINEVTQDAITLIRCLCVSSTPLLYGYKARGFMMGCWCMFFLWSKKSLEITNYQPTCWGPCQYFFQSDYLLFPIGCSPKQSCFVLLELHRWTCP